MSLRDEVTELLQELIRLDTVNPPGNETIAAELLRDYLARNGVDVQLYAKVPERANLVARLEGGDGPTLCTDLATPTPCSPIPPSGAHDPWSGELIDGEVWGRGALDMKGQVAAARSRSPRSPARVCAPPGDLIFAATADEEVGDGFGLEWLVEAHPDAVRCDYCPQRGRRRARRARRAPFYLVSTAEKMSAPFRLTVHGRSGHASMPGIADNALVKAAAARAGPRRVRASRAS